MADKSSHWSITPYLWGWAAVVETEDWWAKSQPARRERDRGHQPRRRHGKHGVRGRDRAGEVSEHRSTVKSEGNEVSETHLQVDDNGPSVLGKWSSEEFGSKQGRGDGQSNGKRRTQEERKHNKKPGIIRLKTKKWWHIQTQRGKINIG